MTNLLKDREVPDVILRWNWKDAAGVMTAAGYELLKVNSLCHAFILARMTVSDVIKKENEELLAVRMVGTKGLEMFDVAVGAAIETVRRLND